MHRLTVQNFVTLKEARQCYGDVAELLYAYTLECRRIETAIENCNPMSVVRKHDNTIVVTYYIHDQACNRVRVYDVTVETYCGSL